LHTPADIHYGTAEAVRDKRAAVLADAYRVHPERFIRKPPEPPHLPTGSWIPTRQARGGHSVNTARRCLIQVDSFRRGPGRTHVALSREEAAHGANYVDRNAVLRIAAAIFESPPKP